MACRQVTSVAVALTLGVIVGCNGMLNTLFVATGDVSMAVPSDFAAAMELTASIGHVNARLTDFTLTGLESAARAVTATLNGGGGAIVGQTGIGNVTFDSLN